LGIQKDRIIRFIDRDQFSNLEIILTLLAIAAWIGFPQMHWLPLGIASVPWAFRLGAKRISLPQKPFQFAIFLFLGTALIGVWAAYDRAAAWSSFWTILGSVLLFFVILQQPAKKVLWLLALLSSYGAGLALFFLLSHNWGTLPTDFEALNHIAARWMSIRPRLFESMLHPNQVAGILAIIFPLSLAFTFQRWKDRVAAILLLLANGLILIAVVMTSSRAAWLAMVSGFATWLLWLLSRYVSHKYQIRANRFFWSSILAILLVFFFYGIENQDKLLENVSAVPGASSAESRYVLFKNSLFLFSDFPLTGGGLASFPGLYSHYMLVLPIFIFSYSHNLYLDIAIEQGIVGIGSWVFLLILCSLVIAQYTRDYKDYPTYSHTLVPSLFAGFVTLGVHGLVDNPFAANWSKPFLFLLPAFLLVCRKPIKRRESKSTNPVWILSALILIVGFVAIWLTPRTLRAIYNANIGAVKMSRLDLVDWPTGEWDDGSDIHAYKDAERLLIKAIVLDEENLTANYRLGRLAMLRRDFETAAHYLEIARQVSQTHRGVTKSLGYCYTWVGQLDKAEAILGEIRESQSEMQNYSWWWGAQGYPELAERASQMVARLEAGTTSQ
jgi:hypothetical protein